MVHTNSGSMLVVGNRRSYSDVCRNQNGTTKTSNHGIVAFDRAIGVARCRAGTTIYQIINATGLRPPVVPGTGWATIGGCIANDVHGKNHKTHGTFGHYVKQINLNGEGILPSDARFAATIGGLGLTGEIIWADIKLVPHNPFAAAWLFPLDYIPGYWPIYKHLKCWQYHCVVPHEAVKRLHQIARNRPFLTVHKNFGNRPSIGMLSFCRPGISVSMDFGPRHKPLQDALDEVVMAYEGAIYPAKTSMSAVMFKISFPRWHEFSRYVHPSYSSDFWRRVCSE